MSLNYDFTTQLYYTLGQLGLGVDLSGYGLNVAVDIAMFAGEIHDKVMKNGKSSSKNTFSFDDLVENGKVVGG